MFSNKPRLLLPLICATGLSMATSALAGPPYATDDPEPTDWHHTETYVFRSTQWSGDGRSGAYGLDINYGAFRNVQLTAVLPVAYEKPSSGAFRSGLGNIELAAKFKVHDQTNGGWDVALFPKLSIPTRTGFDENHFSLILPVWVQKDYGKWSVFGGGGCVLNRGDGSHDYCLGGLALSRQVTDKLRLGAEVFAQGSEARGEKATRAANIGLVYDLNDHYHLLLSAGPQKTLGERRSGTNLYVALQTTY